MDVGELFRGGTLDMSAEPWPALAAGAAWTDFLTNRIFRDDRTAKDIDVSVFSGQINWSLIGNLNRKIPA